MPVGGMWVESDAVLPGGESLVRQFLARPVVLPRASSARSSEVWLPDSFGYSGALPQIIRGRRRRYFLTQKISWNQINRFPHHTFWWEGIDGTAIFTHFPPADTYNGELTPKELILAAANFRGRARRPDRLSRSARRRRRRPHPRDAGARAARREWRACPGCARGAGRVLHASSEDGRGAAAVVRRALPGVAPRHATSQAAMKRGNRRASTCCARPSCGAATAAGAPGPIPGRGLRSCRDRAAAPVPRHPAGHAIAWVYRDWQRTTNASRAPPRRSSPGHWPPSATATRCC